MKTILFAMVSLPFAMRAADEFIADSSRGARLFEALSCIQCHSISGRGGGSAPDLGRIADRDFTPAKLAATMWNHAPTMWASMQARNIVPGDLNPQAARDLFAYFYSTGFFEKPGDAARGKHVFSDRGCRKCHGLTEPLRPSIKPVSQWEALDRPIDLVRHMWNHQAYMLAERGPWPRLSGQDLADMQVYLRHLPLKRSADPVFNLRGPTDGAAIYASKGCAVCHSAASELTKSLRGATLIEIAAEMWNHAPRMASAGAKPAQFTAAEMQALLSFLWVQQFFQNAGNPTSGRHVFEAKHCAACHRDPTSGAPAIEGKPITAADMVAILWRHGPQMLDRMKSRNIVWPRFSASQMSDLIAYLGSPR